MSVMPKDILLMNTKQKTVFTRFSITIFYKIGFFLISIHTGNITDFPNLSILVFSYIFPKFMKKCIPNSHIMPINLLYSCK